MKIFTIKHDKILNGAVVEQYREWPVITVGESGRGRELGMLFVKNAKPGDVVYYGELDEEKALCACQHSKLDFALVVLKTVHGFRGSCKHAGDRYVGPCPRQGETIRYRYACPKCNTRSPNGEFEQWTHPQYGQVHTHLHFPGEVITQGIIADGAAGRMASGEQIIAVVPEGIVFSALRSGRLYGSPKEHYYLFDGEQIITATWAERETLPLF